MNARFEKYLDNANISLQQGFQSKASKKRANEYIGRAYECVSGTFHPWGMMEIILKMKQYDVMPDNHDELYYGVPDLHHWKAKHDDMYKELFPSHVALIHILIDMRQAVKDAPIVPKGIPSEVKRVNKIQKSIRETLEKRKQQYVNGLDISKEMNGMNVTANVHLVHGHKGTVFVRAFYYLHGAFMPLSTIIAIGERYDAWKKEKGLS